MEPSQVIIQPVVSEKSYVLAATGRYTFRIHPDAHKTQVRQAVEDIFGVKVTQVNISKVPAKPKRRGVHAGERPGWKKAVVTVAEGQSIEAFGPGV